MLAMSNAPEFYEWLFGIWHAGMVGVPSNAKLHPAELAYIARNSGSRVVVTDDKLASSLASVADEVEDVEVVLVIGRELEHLLNAAEVVPLFHVAGESPAWLFYTSGTTGRPKGATLTHRNLLTMTLSYYADIDRVGGGDCILHAAPMSHGSGLYGLSHVAKGANNVIPESGGFDPEEIFTLLTAHPGTTFFAAPTMVVRLLNSRSAGGDTGNLKLICYGGGPMYVSDTERALALFGPKLAQVYGQGESPMTITALTRDQHAERHHPRYRQRLGSVGQARTDVEVAVVDAQDRPLPPNEAGEVVVRGDVVMAGYWNNPAATEESLRGGWLHTGDIGALDDEGFLTLLDRSKDLIISGGSNVYPREVEEVLLQHPAILEAAAIGRPDPEWGEVVVAFVVARDGQTLDLQEVDRHCLAHLARFKRPREYIVENSLPKNNYGKIMKRDLRQRLDARRG